jgi:hypothetical protein
VGEHRLEIRSVSTALCTILEPLNSVVEMLGRDGISTCIRAMERSEELYQRASSSGKSIEGCSGEVTLHQVACHFHFLYFRSQITGDCGERLDIGQKIRYDTRVKSQALP